MCGDAAREICLLHTVSSEVCQPAIGAMICTVTVSLAFIIFIFFSVFSSVDVNALKVSSEN